MESKSNREENEMIRAVELTHYYDDGPEGAKEYS